MLGVLCVSYLRTLFLSLFLIICIVIVGKYTRKRSSEKKMSTIPPPFKNAECSVTEVGGIPFHLSKERIEHEYTQNKPVTSLKGPCFCITYDVEPCTDEKVCTEWQELTHFVRKHPKFLALKDKIRKCSAILRLKKKTAHKIKNLSENDLNKKRFMEYRKNVKPVCSPLINNKEWLIYLQDAIKICVLEPVLSELQLMLFITKNDKHHETVHKEYKKKIANSSPKLSEVLSLLYNEYLESGITSKFDSYLKKILGKVDKNVLIEDLDSKIAKKKIRLEELYAKIKESR